MRHVMYTLVPLKFFCYSDIAGLPNSTNVYKKVSLASILGADWYLDTKYCNLKIMYGVNFTNLYYKIKFHANFCLASNIIICKIKTN